MTLLTPDFVKIKKKKSKRVSPYSANEIWELEELLLAVKYEPLVRNQAAIMMAWDLDARNHEVTNIGIKNIKFKEKYAEGEIPEHPLGHALRHQQKEQEPVVWPAHSQV